jgi:uncharacterized integral membrane protein
MAVVTWIIRLAVLLVVTAFAINNSDPVTLKTFLGYQWQTPLVVALLVFFIGGVIIGLLGLVGTIVRLKREIAQLKRTHQRELATQSPSGNTPEVRMPPPM